MEDKRYGSSVKKRLEEKEGKRPLINRSVDIWARM